MKNHLLSRRGIWLLVPLALQAGVKTNGVGAEYATMTSLLVTIIPAIFTRRKPWKQEQSV